MLTEAEKQGGTIPEAEVAQIADSIDELARLMRADYETDADMRFRFEFSGTYEMLTNSPY